jgi:predicted MPP superfamily phosphohydrolase
VQRRKFLRNTIITSIGVGLLGSIYSWQIEPFWLEFVKVKMPIKNLPKELIGKTVMQISDVHVGNRFNYEYIIDSFKKAHLYNPDFVKLGTAGILGNHDYGLDWLEPDVADKISSILDKAGVTILRNEEMSFSGLNIIGIDDYWGTNFNPVKIMNNYDDKKANLVLCHNPDVCDLNVWNNYKGWILAGHTHGGQVKPPFLNPPLLPVKNKRYSSGEIDLHDGRTLYINRALGNIHQVRFNVRPEITLFELEKEM